MFDCPQCNTRHNTGERCARIIPQSYIDWVQLELDQLLQNVKDAGADNVTTESLALTMFNRRGLLEQAEHRQILSVMVAILLQRVSFNG